MHGHGVRGSNSNITGRCWFKWRGVECDLVNNGGVFIAKDWGGCMWPIGNNFDD
jgi:hypothetical protein